MINNPATDIMTVSVEAMQGCPTSSYQVEVDIITGPTKYTVHVNMKLDIEFMIGNITGFHRSFNKLTGH